MSNFEKYFDKDFAFLSKELDIIDIDSLITDKMQLIVGDFYGIQKFIFERLATKNASKVLRAKSAYIQLFTEYIAKYICHKLNIDEKCILTINAGKFEILAPVENVDLSYIQQKINNFFINKFYALSGLIVCNYPCSKDEIQTPTKYRKLRNNIALVLEEKKFQKFNLSSLDSVMDYDTSIDNQSLCKICNIRKITNTNCEICNSFINLGTKLSKTAHKINSKKDLHLDFDDFVIEQKLTEKIKSYIYYIDNSPADFQTLTDASCQDQENSGIKALGVLKADIDSMGNYLDNSDITESFKNFDLFSKSIDSFFSIYIPRLMAEKYSKYPHTYTVFAGGDDLFLIGAWDEILELARKIRAEFKKFIKVEELSISFGIAITKPSIPVSYLANYTEKLLEEAKEIDDDKDAISLFNETVKWESYLKIYEELYPKLNEFENINTTLLYRLLDFCEMQKNIEIDIKNTLWKSKLNYLFYRNISKENHPMLSILDKHIEHNPKETKMILSEFIYKRRQRA